MMTLQDELRGELERCTRLLADYGSLGSLGAFGTALAEAAIRRGEDARRGGDSRRMQVALADLRRFEALGPIAAAGEGRSRLPGPRWTGGRCPRAASDTWVVNAI